MGFCFAGAHVFTQCYRVAYKPAGGLQRLSFCSSLLLRRLQLHELVNHSFQAFKHFVIAEDKHLQSPFPLVQQHGLTGCARHVVDVGNDHAGKRLTIHNEVHIDGLAAALCQRLHDRLLDGRKRRFDVRSGRPVQRGTFGSVG